MRKENIKTIVIICLVLIILIGGTQTAYTKLKENIYSNGFNDGQTNLYNQILTQLNQNGEVIIPITTNNQTINIRLVMQNE